jgi:lysophospholipase L1-like esterase
MFDCKMTSPLHWFVVGTWALAWSCSSRDGGDGPAGGGGSGVTTSAGSTVVAGPGTTTGAGGATTTSGAGGSGPGGAECTESALASPADADNPCIQLHGRWDRSNPKGPVARWGAVYVTAKFEGTSLKLRMTDEQKSVTTVWMGTTYELGPNHYVYSVDDRPVTLLKATAATEYTLASGLSDGPHTVMLARRSESKFGTTTFQGFTLDAGKHLLMPDPPPARKVEVFGDSITAGLADENTGPYNAATSNGYESYAAKLARSFGAEWAIEARGGGSFFLDYLPMVPWFDKTFGPLDNEMLPDGAVPVWSFDRWQPDVFILALGTNDSSDMYPASDEAAYVAKYRDFLSKLRQRYPNAHVFALAPWKEGAPWDLVRSHIAKAVVDQADSKIHAILPVDGTNPTYSNRWLDYPADYVTGDMFHPNLTGHQKIADKLKAIVAPIVGW